MSIYLGIGLALCSCTCSAVGYTLQKRAHNRFDADVAAADAADAAAEAERSSQSSTTPSNTTPLVAKRKNGFSEGEADRDTIAEDTHVTSSRAIHPAETEAEVAVVNVGMSVSPTQIAVKAKSWRPKSYVYYWQFGAGLALLIAGTVCAAFVLGLAPQSTLAPLGSVTMILNTILSWRFLGETFTRVDFASVILMASGTTIAVLFGKGSDAKYTLDTVIHLFVDRPAAWSLALCSGVCIAAATTYVYTIGRTSVDALTPATRSLDVFCRSFLGAAWSGYSNFAAKAVVEVAFSSVSRRSGSDWARPELYLLAFIMVFSLVMQVKNLNLGLAKYDSIIVVRLYQALLALSSILSGFFYFNEVAALTSFSIGMFCLGVGIVLIGIVVGMLRKLKHASTKSPPSPIGPVEKAPHTPLMTDAVTVTVYTVPPEGPNV